MQIQKNPTTFIKFISMFLFSIFDVQYDFVCRGIKAIFFTEEWISSSKIL